MNETIFVVALSKYSNILSKKKNHKTPRCEYKPYPSLLVKQLFLLALANSFNLLGLFLGMLSVRIQAHHHTIVFEWILLQDLPLDFLPKYWQVKQIYNVRFFIVTYN